MATLEVSISFRVTTLTSGKVSSLVSLGSVSKPSMDSFTTFSGLFIKNFIVDVFF